MSKRTRPNHQIQDRVSFSVSLRFELFYAIRCALDPEARVHQAWRQALCSRLPPSFAEGVARLGGSSLLWADIADAILSDGVDASFASLLGLVENVDLGAFQSNILVGALHDEEVVAELIAGKTDLPGALRSVRQKKREWFAYLGLYPFQAESPMARGLTGLLESPDLFRRTVIEVLQIFWDGGFHSTWSDLQAQLERSAGEKQRMLASSSFSEFARRALLRIEVDEAKGRIRAVRGGYSLAFDDVERIHMMPSLFNDQQLWSAFEDPATGRTTVFFPYFDPAIAVGVDVAPAVSREMGRAGLPEIDPALVFKALGDTTRFAIARLIAHSTRTSTELARALAVSKATISHHVQILRMAGLIDETWARGAVHLALRREVVERLSDRTIQVLWHAPLESELSTSRRTTSRKKKRE